MLHDPKAPRHFTGERQQAMSVQAQQAQDRKSTDRIEKRFEVRAPRARVWRAIANAKEFGTWFGMKLEDAFVAGRTVRGRITIPNYDHLTLEMQIERVEPEQYFSYRWHPYAIDPKVDYSKEPTTLVEFQLEEIADGTAVTIVESGFDKIPLARRADAFRMNEQGWTGQAKKLAQYVA
jgi:uncharacterized protein YndB with AHSA1/START domain